MFERFTDQAIKVIWLAQEESRRLGHNLVGTEQILLGLVGEQTGIAAKVLRRLGANLEDTRLESEKLSDRGDRAVFSEMPFTPDAKSLLQLSWNEARQLGAQSIDTEHLLLGLTKLPDGYAAQVLNRLGISLETVRQAILIDLCRAAGSLSHPSVIESTKDSNSGPQESLSQQSTERSPSAEFDPWAALVEVAVPFKDPGSANDRLFDRLSARSITCVMHAREFAAQTNRPLDANALFFGLLADSRIKC
jgi:ATP-dependent Clp protease ATP-binding subunit ClpC